MNIPCDALKSIEEKVTENVLLLAMSTLPKNIKQNKYYYKINDQKVWNFYGKSQLAADTKAIMSIVESGDSSLDRIVILATKETMQVIEEKNISAVDYYKDEIISYLKATNIEIDEHIIKQDLVNDVFFKVISLDNDDAFSNAVEVIKGYEGNKIKLYIDVQGGIRSAAIQINAIVELLSNQNVEIVGRFANDYNPQSAGPYLIHSVDSEYKTYNLVTAMEMFKKYGRGTGLQEYFDNARYRDDFANRLSNAIKTAADSIQLCDVDGFDKAINKIRKLDDGINIESISPELRIIYQDIKEDYAPLINAKYRYVQQIRWCLNKNFIQQAMTILESKMPDEYVLNGIKYFCKNSEKTQVIEKLEKIYNSLYTGKNKKNSYKMKNINHYYINYYYMGKDKKGKEKGDINVIPGDIQLDNYYGLDKDDYKKLVEENLDEYRNIKTLRNQVNHAQSEIKNDGFMGYMKKKYPHDYTFNNRKQEVDIIGKILDYLENWEKLADQISVEVRENIADVR